MSTATEITRITTARNTIRNKLIALGLAASTDKIDALATAVDGITNQGAVSATVQEGATYTIPAGYHNGSGTVSGVGGGGNYSLQSKTATPTKSQQSITPDSGYYGLSDVTVAAIPDAYQDVSSVTAAAGDVLATKIFVDDEGTVTTGTMPNNGAVSQTLDVRSGHTSYTVPAGYHNGSGTVSLVTETKSATPSGSSQDITPTAGKVLAKVTVAAIPSEYVNGEGFTASEAQVLEGYSAGVLSESHAEPEVLHGTMPNRGAVSKTLDATSNNQSYTVPAGYHNGSGSVGIVLEEKSVSPTRSSQVITPTSGKVLSKVTVGKIGDYYADTTGDDAVAGNLLAGKKAHSYSGGNAVALTGSMPNNGAVAATIDGLTTTSYTVPAGYHNGSGTVSLTNDIETALAAI